MTIYETQFPNGGYEQRYCVAIGSSDMPMVRRPVSMPPPEGTICFVDSGERWGPVPRQSAAAFRGNKFVGVKFEPTHWTHWDA